jgi:hypothetical protein
MWLEAPNEENDESAPIEINLDMLILRSKSMKALRAAK